MYHNITANTDICITKNNHVMKTKRILGIILSTLIVIGGLGLLVYIASLSEALIGLGVALVIVSLIYLALYLLLSED